MVSLDYLLLVFSLNIVFVSVSLVSILVSDLLLELNYEHFF
jgi:hypothetical protein